MSRPSKKRALMPSLEMGGGSTPAASSASKRRPSANSMLLTTSHTLSDANLDASMYKAELEHERSLRALDVKRAQQKEQRLEKLVEFSQEELEQCKLMLEEERHQSELHMDQLRQARDDAIQKFRDYQQQQQQQQGYDDEDEYDSEDDGEDSRSRNERGTPQDSLWKRKYELLQSQMEAKDSALDQVRLQLREVQSQVKESLEERKKIPGTPPAKSPAVNDGALSPAPSDLLHELNRIRIELAESERKQRQIRRAAEEWQKKAKQLLPEKEAARALQIRVQKLEGQLRDIQKTHQLTLAENEEWQQFCTSLAQYFPAATIGIENESTSNTSRQNPPEVTTILRHVGDVKQQLKEAQEHNQVLEQRVEKLKDWKRPAEQRMKMYDEKQVAWDNARKDLEQQLDAQKRRAETLEKQEHIWKREIASLQELVQSFDGLPVSGGNSNATTTALTNATADAKLKTMELQLKSLQEELQVVMADRDRLQLNVTETSTKQQECHQELDRVKEKYGKLREALEIQKGKVEEAEARAHRAEELSGMGSFNPNETRVLHLSQNPLTDTLRQQNAALKKQLEEASQSHRGTPSVKTSRASMTPQSEVNPDKLHQRLKQSFKEQIGLFREGVYLMTGYKIDMLPGVDRPTFRVRSMYAGREEDHLMLKWPKLKLPEGESVTSLDLLGTEWATALSHSDSFAYMTKFNSLPAFLASVQLAEFEKQTMM